MFLSDFINKTITLDNTSRGVCIAIGISLKNKELKYLFCSVSTPPRECDFVLPIGALLSKSENTLSLSRIRPVIPQKYYKLTPNLPIYSENGVFLGHITNVRFENNVAISIQTDMKNDYLFTQVIAINDAMIIRNPKPYPLTHTTKQALKKAIEKESLISFTLSLPPFANR